MRKHKTHGRRLSLSLLACPLFATGRDDRPRARPGGRGARPGDAAPCRGAGAGAGSDRDADDPGAGAEPLPAP